MNELNYLAGRLQTALGGIDARIQTVTAAAATALDEAHQRAELAEADLQALRAAAENETGALAEAQDAVAMAVGRAEAAEAAQAEAEAGLKSAQARIVELESELASTAAPAVDESALREAEEKIAELTQNLDLAKAELAEVSEARAADTVESAALNDKLTALQSGDTLMAQKARGEAEDLLGNLTQSEAAIAELQRVNAQLRTNNAALRGAIESGLSDPSLVDGALKSELESLQAARNADRAELDNVLAALAPVLKEA